MNTMTAADRGPGDVGLATRAGGGSTRAACGPAPCRAARILLVDNDPLILDSLGRFLRGEGHDVALAATARDAIQRLSTGAAAIQTPAPAAQAGWRGGGVAYDLVIVDVGMPDRDGFALLAHVRENHPRTAVLMITAYGTMELAVEALKQGAYEYIAKPIIDDDVRLAVGRAMRHQELADENRRLRKALGESPGAPTIISQDYRMARVFDLLEAVASARATVLLYGESGTGKSLLARAIHARSDRRDGPFVEVSCGAVPDTLLESELFGHVRGAFTGAAADQEGKFAAADGGTIFLDEVAAASPQLQVKLLRVLQERRFEPVGSTRTREADCRVILATHRDLSDEVKAGRFREDLYYRINVVTIELPPLRARAGDIPLLAKHFLEKHLAGSRKMALGFSPEAMAAMQSHQWPGNVRELENCVERAVVLSRGLRIGLEDLPQAVRDGADSASAAAAGAQSMGLADGQTLTEALLEPQRRIILSALRAHGGNRKAAARQLGINRATLYKKMRKLRITE
jgi:DNA-binding NtrC family response regulator